MRKVSEIEKLGDIELLDAIAEDMWGPPPTVPTGGFGGQRNHNAKLARLAGVSTRRIRQYREAGKIDPKRRAIIIDRWKLWRAENAGKKK